MAWSTIVETDVFLVGLMGLVGVAVGALFWGRGDGLLLMAVRPARSIVSIFLMVMGVVTIALAPGVALAMWRTHAAGGSPCISAAMPHMWVSLAFGLALGFAAARRLNPVLAAVVVLGVIGFTYVAIPALTGKKLINVGVTPLPMMDQRRSWEYAVWMCAALTILAVFLLWSIARKRAWQAAGVAAAVAAMALLALPLEPTFTEHHYEHRVCDVVPTGQKMCVPKSYAWLKAPALGMASRMLTSATARGLEGDDLPSRFEFGQFEDASDPSVARMTPTSAFASSGSLPPVEVAGLLATPSWCREMRAAQAPEGLLKQTGVVAVWFAVQGGYVAPGEAPSLVAPDLPNPASLTTQQVSDALRAAKDCHVASWVG